jgi:DNA-binding NarL/FixJ family response regulator
MRREREVSTDATNGTLADTAPLRSADTVPATWVVRQPSSIDSGRTANLHLQPVPTRTVLVAGTTTTVVEAFAAALHAQGDLAVVGTATNETDLFRLVNDYGPEVILAYVPQPSAEFVDTIARLKTVKPQVRIVLLTAQPDLQLLAQAAATGGAACLSHDTGLRDVVGAIRADTIDTMLVGVSSFSVARPVQDLDATDHAAAGLTPRELQVLALLADGCSPPTIAARLVISIYTARGHVKNVLRKLGAHSQLEAVAAATRLGLLPRNRPPSGQVMRGAADVERRPRLGWR